MMQLFLGMLNVMVTYFLLPTFLISIAVGFVRGRRTNRAFSEILIRVILMTLGIGLPICAVLAALVTWWIMGHVPAPD
jgi:hypothetical protein